MDAGGRDTWLVAIHMSVICSNPKVSWMFATTSVQEFFPTPIWIVDLQATAADALNKRLMAQFEHLAGSRPAAGVGSTWQTDPDLHKRPEFAELTGLLRKAVKACLDFLQVDYDDFLITGCWANFNPTGGLNSAHTHPNNYLSGVYYLRTPAGADTIEFTDPRPAAVARMPRAKTLNRFNGNRMTVQTKPGRFVLFPAWLSHNVPVNRTSQERVSIAFNAMYANFAETMSAPLWKGTLHLK
jgi:uncharacterized protein (TIGR02466 family)